MLQPWQARFLDILCLSVSTSPPGECQILIAMVENQMTVFPLLNKAKGWEEMVAWSSKYRDIRLSCALWKPFPMNSSKDIMSFNAIFKIFKLTWSLIELTKALSRIKKWIQRINYGWFTEIGSYFHIKNVRVETVIHLCEESVSDRAGTLMSTVPKSSHK